MKDAETLPADGAVAIEGELPVVDPSCYELGEELARGGFGRLIRARDKRLDREVAIKQLRASNAQLETRFRLEARITARLSHSAIVPVHEVGRWPSGEPFYAMKLVTGRSLRDILDATPALVDRLALVPAVVGVADAVGYAHGEGVLHRDLKPSNIMIDARGDAFVVDWGLARDRASTEPAGSVVGTPPYLSPEQARGDVVDERADVYSLGALLYELVSGTTPYAGDSDAVLAAIATAAPPPLSARQPSAPRDLVAIVERAMARDAKARYPSGRELAEDLRKFARGELVAAYRYSATERGRRWLRRHRGASIAVALVLAASSGVIAWFATRTPPASWRPQFYALPHYEENSSSAMVSPDGKLLAYDSNRDGRFRVYTSTLFGDDERTLTEGELGANLPRFTPDGRILIRAEREDGISNVFAIPPTGGVSELVVRGPVGVHVACGGGIVVVRHHRCWLCASIVMLAPDGNERELAHFAPGKDVFSLRCDRAGRRLLFGLGRNEFVLPRDSDWEIWLLELDGSAPRRLLERGTGNLNPTFVPDDNSIVFSSSRAGARNLWEMSLDDGRLQQITFGAGPDIVPEVTPDGRMLVFQVDTTSYPLLEVTAGAAPRRLTLTYDNVARVGVTSDGTALVFELEHLGSKSIVVRTLATGTERVLGGGGNPALGPGDRDVIWARGGEIIAAPLAGGPERIVGRVPGEVFWLAVGPDGVVHVALLDAEGVAAWKLSPDGVASRELPAPYVIVIPAPRGGWQLAISAQVGELVPPHGEVGDPQNPHVRMGYAAWDADGESFLYQKSIVETRRYWVTTGKDELALKIDLGWDMASSPDRKTTYIAQRIGRIRRQLITNFGDRPRLR